MNFGENVKTRREEIGLTRLALAEKIGVSGPAISQIERGTKCASVNLAVELAKALDCELMDLINGWGGETDGSEG